MESLGNSADTIRAVINLDMLGWDLDGEAIFSVVTQTDDAETYEAQQNIEQVFLDVVQNYGLKETLTPKNVTDDKLLSDQVSFWNAGIPAIFITEDAEDFSPNANQKEDVLENLNPGYFANTVKAIIGAFADLAGISE